MNTTSEKLDFTGELTDEHKREMEKHANYDKNNIGAFYDELSTNYEDIYLTAGWNDPRINADFVIELYTTTGKPKEEVDVLDLGCGTGLIGKYLLEDGFKNVVGLDASRGMLNEARRRNYYSEYIELFLGNPDTYPENLRDKFDFTTASGILADNHLDCSVFEEMLLSLRKGGIAVFATRIEYLTSYGYADYMKKLEEEGKWKFLKETTFDRYFKL